jgi:hypothetical protein
MAKGELVMLLNIRARRWRLTIILTPVTDTIGVNSQLPDGNHIIMWDFDDQKPDDVVTNLLQTQHIYDLPNIYVLETKPKKNYIAYCFRRCTWQESVKIVAATKGICYNFFKWGVFRKRWTLRVGVKHGTIPHFYKLLKGKAPEEAKPRELRSWVNYETVQDEFKHKVLNLGRRIQ